MNFSDKHLVVLVHDNLYASKAAIVFFGIDMNLLTPVMSIDDGRDTGRAGIGSVVRNAEVLMWGGSKVKRTYRIFVCEQDFVRSLFRNHIMGVNHLIPRNGGTRFNERARRGDRLYIRGRASIARCKAVARYRKEKQRLESKRAKTTKRAKTKNGVSGTRYSKRTFFFNESE